MTMITPQNMHEHLSPTWQKPAVSNDTRQLAQGLWATFKCADFNHQILPGRFVEAFTGEYLELLSTVGGCNHAFNLVRCPPQSKAHLAGSSLTPNEAGLFTSTSKPSLSGNRLILDAPGLWVVRVTLDKSWSQEIRCAVFPVEASKWLGYPEQNQAAQRRLRLRAIVRDDRVTDATVIDSLEGDDDPMFGLGGRICGAGRPLETGSSASGNQSFSVGQYLAG